MINFIQSKYGTIILFLFAVVVAGLITSCDVFNSDSNSENASNREPFFNFEVQDENGEIITKASNEQVDDPEIETSVGLFGEQFISPASREAIIENAAENGVELDSADFRQLQIFLYAKKGINENTPFVGANFIFPLLEQWKSGRFQVNGLTKEEWVDIIRGLLEDSKEHGFEFDGIPQGFFTISRPNANEHSSYMNYSESGFADLKYVFQPADGFVELENITDDRMEGMFSVNLWALPADLMLGDEFPEDAFRTFRITGDFMIEHGDYEDLEKVRSDFIRGLLNAGVTGGL